MTTSITMYASDTFKQNVPEGWYGLVDRLFMSLPYFQEYYELTVDKDVRKSTPQLQITNVGVRKGKFFAELNFPFPEMLAYIKDLAVESESICQHCASASRQDCLDAQNNSCKFTH